jgi:hypothetical protein
MPTRGASAGQLSRRRGWRSATVRGMSQEAPDPNQETDEDVRGSDLLTIALLVFFVSLILIVAALVFVVPRFVE